jgi:hypothetical protein
MRIKNNGLTNEPVVYCWPDSLYSWIMILASLLHSMPSNLHTLPMHLGTHECAVTKSRGYLMVMLVSTPASRRASHRCAVTKSCGYLWLPYRPVSSPPLRPQVARWQQRLWLLGGNSVPIYCPHWDPRLHADNKGCDSSVATQSHSSVPTETPRGTLTTKVVTLRWKLSPFPFS